MESDSSIESGSSDESADSVGCYSNSATYLSSVSQMKSTPKLMTPVYVQSQISKPSTVTSSGKHVVATSQNAAKDTKESPVDGKVTIVSMAKGSLLAPRPGTTFVANGAFSGARKVVPVNSSTSSYLGPMGIRQNEKNLSTHKVILTSVKGKSNDYQTRILVPANQSSVASSPIPVAVAPSGVNVVMQQTQKQISKGYLVNPSSMGPRGTVSILPRNTFYVDAQGKQQKVLSSNLIKYKSGRIINANTLRSVNMLTSTTGGKVISPITSTYNVITVPSKTRPSLVSSKPIAANDRKSDGQTIVVSTDDTTVNKLQLSPSKWNEIRNIQNHQEKTDIGSSEDAVISPARHMKSAINVEATSGDCSGQQIGSPQKAVLEHKKSRKSNFDDRVITIDDVSDPEEDKTPTFRKAKILTFSKAKGANSLLNGVKDNGKLDGSQIDIPLINRRSVGSPLAPERVRKRKDNHKPTTMGEPPQKLMVRPQQQLKLITGAENRDPLKVVKWDNNGIGMLPGSTLKFTFNEFGMLEMHEDALASKMVFYKDDKDNEQKIKNRDPSEIYCCAICSCYGLLSEFFNENFCSVGCWETFSAQQETISQKLEDEPTPSFAVDVESKKRKNTGENEVGPTEEPLPKQKKTSPNLSADDEDSSSSGLEKKSSEVSVSKMRKSLATKVDKNDAPPVVHKPFIKVKSLESLTGVPAGRQLRTRDNALSPPKKVRHIPSQDLEGLPPEEEKIPGDNVDFFSWADYLHKTNSKPAWIKLFSNLLPSWSNPFKIGFKLEAIDPERPSLFCAATIADVQGLRIKVHFDGFPNKYDFWTNISSHNIFPCGFCEQNDIPLQPPAGINKRVFSWQQYNSSRKARPAPLSWFQNHQVSGSSTNMFRSGMKLEAVDKKNTQLTCVATVNRVIENRILVHFDSWSDVYDYWVETSSPYIHPVGWCKERNREITPPNGYSSTNFSWPEYLKKTGSEAAPTAAFMIRPPIEFKRGTKLEAIDKRASHLLRVATIKEVLPYQIKLSFDGFPDHFGYWCDDDSPDIHPINWGKKTGHPIAGPPETYEIASSKCPTPGCIGDGNYFGLASEFHTIQLECPYWEKHLNAESPLQDRLAIKPLGRKDKQSNLHSAGHNSDSDNEFGSANRWQFLDDAVERSESKERLLQDGTSVKTTSSLIANSRLSTNSKVNSTAPSSTKIKAPANKAKTTNNVSPSVGGVGVGKRAKKASERRASEKNVPESTTPPAISPRLRSTQPVKSTTGVQAGSPVKKTSTQGVENADKSAKNCNVKDKNDENSSVEVPDQCRTKMSNDDCRLKNEQDVVFWTSEQCLDRIQTLGSKIHSAMAKQELDGEKLLMLTVSDLNGELNGAESKILLNYIADLRKKATIGLDVWKKIENIDSKNL